MVKKIISKDVGLRKRVYDFSDLHPTWPKKDIVKHFMLENVPRSTIYHILQQKENKISPERKSGSGRIAIKMIKRKITQLKKSIDHKDGVSQNALAKLYNVSQPYINKIINTKTSIHYRKKVKVPKRTEEQKARVRPKCRQLVEKFRRKIVIIDDESYFRLTNNPLSINSGYYTSNNDETPNEVKQKTQAKFEEKLLVWIAISPKGKSSAYIAPSGQAVNEDVYIKECLRRRLIPFIREIHKNDDIVFWPDLASSHYSKKTQEYLKAENIDFVSKARNPANVPELRPIEDFWSELKRVVYNKNWQAKNLVQLERRIRYALKKVDDMRVHQLGKGIFTRLDRVRRHGMKNL